MRHHHHCFALLHQRTKQLEDFCGGFGIEVARGFVSQQQGRVIGQRACNGSALLLAAGHHVGQLVRLIRKANKRQQVGSPLAALAGRQRRRKIHWQHHILQQSQRWQHLKKLEDDPNRGPAPRGEVVLAHAIEAMAANMHCATAGRIDSGHHVKQCGFAIAGRANHGHKLAALHLERNLVENRHHGRAHLEAFRHAIEVNQRATNPVIPR